MKENDDDKLLENININETKNEINNNDKEKKEKKEESKKKEEKIDYLKEVKNYLNSSMGDQEYFDMVKTSPELLFESVDEKKIDFWNTCLSNICPLTFKMIKDKDQEILSHKTTLIESQTVVIMNDSKRTRVRESEIYPDFIETLASVLRYYCEKYKLFYKQGLNEIFGPLILMRYKLKNISLTKIVNLGAMIVDTFFPNYFYEKEIYSLKSALGLYVILLKYHDPTVYNKLDSQEIKPEVYATNWLVTFISGKLNLNMFFNLWDKMISIEDPLFIQFLLVALIKDKRELILNCDTNLLASLMTCLSIRTKEELDKITKIAMELREKTPYSFRILAEKIGFLRKKNKDIKANYEKYHPELLPAMPIFPSEVLYITYKSQIYCIDPNCKNYATDFALKSNLVQTRGESKTIFKKSQTQNTAQNNQKSYTNVDVHYLCEKCDLGIEKNMQYILLDLRILQYDENDDDSDKTGFLPSMINVSQEELKSEEFSNIMTDRFMPERGNYHFIFLTTSTDTFTEFESDLYMENISNEDRKKMMFGIIKQQKIDKTLNMENAKQKLSAKQIYKLKEYDNMRNTLTSMTKHNFPYVGYVYGGFNMVHKESYKFKVELVSHNEETCLLCNEEKKNKSSKQKEEEDENEEKDELYNSLWKHKQKIKYKNLDVFFKNPNNQMHLCVLKEYKKKDIENGQVQILINELFDKFEIEIYKFDKKKQYNDFENTILINNKKQKQEYYDFGKDEQDDNDDHDLELTLLEKVSILDILSLNYKHNMKNVIECQIRGEAKKGKFFGLFKKGESNYETNIIMFDFSSNNDAKIFMQSFKEMIKKYKETMKKK